MPTSLIPKRDAEALLCCVAIGDLQHRAEVPPLLLIICQEVAQPPADAALSAELALSRAEAICADLRDALELAEADLNADARRFVRSVVLSNGMAAHEVNRACFGGMTMTQVLAARREQKMMRFGAYLRNLCDRPEVRYNAEDLATLRASLERLHAANAAYQDVEAPLKEKRGQRRAALDGFIADYSRFANAARALWGLDTARQWLPAFTRANYESSHEDEEPLAFDEAEIALTAGGEVPTVAGDHDNHNDSAAPPANITATVLPS